MTDDEPIHSRLARQMIAALPVFGNWAVSFRDFDTPYGKIGYRQAAILWILRNDSPVSALSPSRLAERFMVQPSVITGALAKLEAAGHITRSSDPRDSRIVRLKISDTGRKISEYVGVFFTTEVAESLEQLDEEELAALQRSIDPLERVGKLLQERRVQKLTRRGTALQDPTSAE